MGEDAMAGIETQPQPNSEAFHALKNPDFVAGNIVMYLTSNPKGMEVRTDRSMRRKDSSLPLSKDQRSQLAFAMGGEMNWTGGASALIELEKLREGKGSFEEYKNKRQKSVYEGNKPKVGLRNIRRDKDTLIVDIKPVSFPVFNNFSVDGSSNEIVNFAEAAATSMAIVTADNKIIVQHRGATNELYPEMPGASVAGTFDGTFKRPKEERLHFEKKGTLEPITETSVLGNIKNESREEMGLEESDFSSIILTGLSEELRPILHHEFLYKAKTNLTSTQIREKALHTTRARKKELKPEDIEEKFDFIEATPEAIFILLTKVKCPLPPTHTAVFAATGYDLVLEKSGKAAADEYKLKLQIGIEENFKRTNVTIKQYYIDHPEKLNEVPERMMKKVNAEVDKFKAKQPNASTAEVLKFKNETVQKLPKKNPSNYSHAFTPSEQGLPDYDTAMQESGLIK